MFILFCILSPGMYLVPPLSPYEAVDRGISYGANPQSCIDLGQWVPECKSNSLFQYRTSSRGVITHSLKFYGLLRFLGYEEAFNLSILFLLRLVLPLRSLLESGGFYQTTYLTISQECYIFLTTFCF